MKTAYEIFRACFAVCGGVISAVLGEMDGFVYTLIALSVIDYITGLMVAVVNKNVSSSIGAVGIFKKILIFCMVAVGHMIDANVLGGGDVMRTMLVFFYISNEGISIIENASKLGLPVPKKLKDILIQLKERKEGE